MSSHDDGFHEPGAHEGDLLSSEQRGILVIDAASEPMQVAATRIRQLGYHVVAAKTPQQAHTLLRSPGSLVGGIVVPSDLAVDSLKRALGFMRRRAPGELTFLAAGARPSLPRRRQLRRAGVELAAWSPIDPHTLRFQVNRALACSDVVLRNREHLRAPAFLPVTLWTGRRQKHAVLYSVSASGAFLAAKRPLAESSLFDLEIPLPSGRTVRSAARVSMCNAPDKRTHKNLPVGMGVRFLSLTSEAQAALRIYAERRMEALVP
jgi:CheY-like chemotaxis protein